MQNTKKHPIRFIMLFYIICFAFRMIEYLFIRTDQSVIGEAFIHKLIGIALLIGAVRLLNYKWNDIGFNISKAIKGTSIGLLLGIAVFTIAYGTEIMLQASTGDFLSLRFYVTSYAIQGNRGLQDGVMFIIICILGNIINVVMEEGVFRGLFLRLTEEKYSFAKACAFSSLLFGIWHIAQPIRNVLYGEQSIPGAMMSGLLLVVTSALLGVQYAMLYKISGSLWIGMAAHFVNNAIINLLHVTTITAIDELQTVRISIAQTLSFVIVLIFYIFYFHKKRSVSHGI